MKKTHIILIIIIAIALGAIITSLSNNSTYASFSDAAHHPGSTFHVVGKLDMSKPFIYDPQTNPNLFTFYMKDREGTECKVTLGKPKPDDFERSDQIVVIGSAPDNSDFQAKDVLMKCPSKYNDGKPQEKQGAM